MSEPRIDKPVSGETPRNLEEDDKSEDPPTRRERSPSAMSHSSGVLEWDPSADVGTIGASNISGERSDLEQNNQLSTLQRHASEVQVLYVGPSYELEAGQLPNRPSSSGSSSNSQKSKAYAYSTPSGSPVPLAALQYSPVPPQANSTPREKDSNANVLEHPEDDPKDGSSSKLSKQATPSAAVSSDDNNNDEDGTEEKVTPPGRVVSEASTDWEYDREKHIPSKSMSQWQTSGMTRSEIAYQNKKNSGSSTSVASSVFLLKVDANLSNQGQQTPFERSKARKHRETSPPKHRDAMTAMSRQFLGRHHHSNPDAGSSDTDPSSMCVLVDDFVKLLESDPGKENIKYDVLKNHRDYHLMKVYKQISKLEKLNMNLLSYKQRNLPEEKPKAVARKQKTETQREVEDIIQFYAKRPSKSQEMEVKLQERLPVKAGERDFLTKVRATDYSSEPISSYKKLVQTLEAGHSRKEAEELQGRSCPALKNLDAKPVALRTSSLNKEQLANILSGDAPPVRREKPKVHKGSISSSSADPPDSDEFERRATAKSMKHDCSDLKEALMKFFDRSHFEREKEKPRRSEKRRQVDAEYLEQLLESIQKKSREKRREPGEHVSHWRPDVGSSRSERSHRSRQNSPPPPPPQRKSPVGFFIPLSSDESGHSGNEIEDRPVRRRGLAKTENGFYDVKAPMAIQDCFVKNNPHCYENVKKRDDFLIHIKRDRQVYNETILREMLQSELSKDEVEQYLQGYIARANEEEKRRLKTIWDQYLDAQNFKENVNKDHIIPLREMKERTARLRKTDPVVLEREKKEAEERRRKASRNLQKDFSSNLRRFQRMGKVDVPGRLKLSTR